MTLAALFAVACSPEGEPTSSNASAIQDGVPVGTDFPAVGTLVGGDGRKHCTATLVVDPKHPTQTQLVITAAHCFALEGTCEAKFPFPGTSFQFGYDTVFALDPVRLYMPGLEGPAAELFSNSNSLSPADYDPATGKCKGIPTFHYYDNRRDEDFALIAVAPPVPANRTPIPVWQADEKAELNRFPEPAGADATWLGASKNGGFVVRRAHGNIFATDTLSDTCQFDPASNPMNPMYSEQTLHGDLPFFGFRVGADRHFGLEEGDSGGPLLVDVGGQFRVAGVMSSYFQRSQSHSCSNEPSTAPGYNVFSSIPSNQKTYQEFLACVDNDADCDGFVDNADDCEYAPDPSQTNSNKDIENATATGPNLGDACDPTPVGISSMPADDGISFTSLASSHCVAGSPNWSALGACNARVDSYLVALDSVWARQAQQPQAPVTQKTGFRHCICTDANGNPIPDKSKCAKAPFNCTFDDGLFGAPEGATKWHHIHVYKGQPQFDAAGKVSNPSAWPDNGSDEPYANGYAELVDFATWDWRTDAPDWQAAGYWSPHPDAYPSGPDIGGVLWTRNDTILGGPAHFTGGADCVTFPTTCHFGDNYTLQNPSRRTAACPVLPDYSDIISGPEELGSTAGGAAASASSAGASPSRWLRANDYTLGIPLLAYPVNGANDPRVPLELVAGSAVEGSFASPCGDSNIARVSAGERPLVVTDLFSPMLVDALLHPAGNAWVTPTEPPSLLRPSGYPISVAVDADGAPRAVSLRDETGRFRLFALDTLPPPPAAGGTGPVAYSRTLGEVAGLVASSPSGPLDTLRVTGFNETAIQTAVSVGGCLDQKAASLKPACRYHGKPITDYQLAFSTAGTGGPRATASVLPMAGRAAVITPEDRRLWLVGTSQRRGGQSRLYEIDTDTGTVQALRALHPGLERFWFATGADNAVVMIAAPPRAPWYLVALFEPDTLLTHARLRLAGLERRTGHPLGGVRVDRGHVLVDDVGPGPLKNPHHPPELRTVAIPISKLRAEKQGTLFAPASP